MKDFFDDFSGIAHIPGGAVEYENGVLVERKEKPLNKKPTCRVIARQKIPSGRAIDRKEVYMNQMNSLIIEGTAENFKSNEKCAEFQISVKRFYRNDAGENAEGLSVFDCEAWGNLKDLLERCLANKSERSVQIVGRLKQHIWKDETGKNPSKVVVVCEHIEFKPVIE